MKHGFVVAAYVSRLMSARAPWSGYGPDETTTMKTADSDGGVMSLGDDYTNPRKTIAFNAKMPTGDESVRCLVCGLELQYITHSHIATHPHGPNTIEKYKQMVSEVLDIDEDEVPIMSSDLSDRLAEKIRMAWEAGDYDHFRMPTE